MKSKILIFILVFSLCFLCFVIPSFAYDDVSTPLSVTDLTGTTWQLPSKVNEFKTSVTYNVDIDFVAQCDNYQEVNSSSIEFYVSSGDYYINLYNSSGNVNARLYSSYNSKPTVTGNYSSGFEYYLLTFTGGTDVTNPGLISWLQSNGSFIVPPPSN